MVLKEFKISCAEVILREDVSLSFQAVADAICIVKWKHIISLSFSFIHVCTCCLVSRSNHSLTNSNLHPLSDHCGSVH